MCSPNIPGHVVLHLILFYLPGTTVLEKNGLSVPQQLNIASSSTTKGVNLCQTAMSMLGFDLGWVGMQLAF